MIPAVRKRQKIFSELLYRIFGQPGNWDVSTAAVVGAYALVTGASIAVIIVSYRRLDVKR